MQSAWTVRCGIARLMNAWPRFTDCEDTVSSLDYGQLVKQFVIMLQHLVEPGILQGSQHRNNRFFVGGQSSVTIQQAGMPLLHAASDPNANLGTSFSLVDEGYDAYESFLDGLEKDVIIGAKVGRKAIEQQVETLLRTYKGQTEPDWEKLRNDLRAAVTYLKNLVTIWNATVPVDNLVLEGLSELKVGNVWFYPTSAVLPQTLVKTNELLDTSSTPEAQRLNLRQAVWEYIAGNFGSTKTCAMLSIASEESRLPSLVDAEVDAALNILRCYMSLLFPAGCRNFIGVRAMCSALAVRAWD